MLRFLQNPRGKLATHDTEDEDKSSSITDHLLHDKSSALCSPDTMRHVNEISNTEDEVKYFVYCYTVCLCCILCFDFCSVILYFLCTYYMKYIVTYLQMPDEDSDVEKLSPLLEVGISYENDIASHIEISITDPTNEPVVMKNVQFGDNQNSTTKHTSPLEVVNPVSSISCTINAGMEFAINLSSLSL